jgi:hypothetical protein
MLYEQWGICAEIFCPTIHQNKMTSGLDSKRGQFYMPAVEMQSF